VALRRILIFVIVALGLLCSVGSWFYWNHSERSPFHEYQLVAGKMEDWKAYGGGWTITDGVVRNNSDERGAKLLAGSADWKDYTLTADLKFDGEHGDMGVIVRSTQEEEGVDAYSGYYAGLRTTDGTLVMGRSDHGWMEARPVPIPGGIHADTWYRLKVTAVGCNIAASSQNLTTMQTAWVAIEEHPCATAGRMGLRSLATGGMWRNISVKRAAFSDYMELRRQASFVGYPEFPKREADYNRIFRFSLTYNDVTQPSGSVKLPNGQSLHIDDLQNLSRDEGSFITLRGVVTLATHGLYIQDSEGGILVTDAQIPPLNVGDAVEVTGHAMPGLYSAVVRGGNVRLLWSGTPIPPIAITSLQAASGAYDSRFVEIEGRLTGMKQAPHGEQILELTQGDQSFQAVYANQSAASLPKLETNSLLRIRGVCVLDRKATRELTPFVILMRSNDDIQTLAAPPWWTPWHVGMLFVVVIGIAMLIQLIHFRIREWQANAITQERDRLAHEIHDTMAQSFAGVGYQIQGIRSGVLRGDHQDFRHIAEQLNVAYQLVRRCHAEASRTIAMLSVPSPEIQNDLLGALANTAHKIAGNDTRTTTKLEGNPVQLHLRLANTLLHIGQEAIANAVGHANPTALTITLHYEGDSVELIVEDNGTGFEYKPESTGFGILGMQKRARDIGSVLNIVSTVGKGTQVRVRAELQPTGSFTRRLVQTFKKSSGLAKLFGFC
jgi:signal transduction histidine kinase